MTTTTTITTTLTPDAQIANLLVQLYKGPTGFDFYEPGNGDSGICWALTKLPNEYIFQLRGSATFEDWFRDLVALATPFQHNVFGPVHQGFLIGMVDAVDEMLSHWDNKTPITLTGHSLGAGRAAIAVAQMMVRGVPPHLLRRIVFGEPKPGLPQLAQFISPVSGRSYRNGTGFHHDTITDLPATIRPLQNYVHPTPLIFVSEPPKNEIEALLDIFGFHHMPLYAAGVAKLTSVNL